MATFRRKVLTEKFDLSILGEPFKVNVRVMNSKDLLMWGSVFDGMQRRLKASSDGYVPFTADDIDHFIDLVIPVIESFEGLTDEDGNEIMDLDESEMKRCLLQVDFQSIVDLCAKIPLIGRLKADEKKVSEQP